jgi:hypothetical protein
MKIKVVKMVEEEEQLTGEAFGMLPKLFEDCTPLSILSQSE